ncbi:MAG: hypothetical protein ACPLPX_01610 [Candidatus Kapaibacteriota bacterium]
MKQIFLTVLLSLFLLASCQKSESPNSLSGDPKTEFTNVGDTTEVSMNLTSLGFPGKTISFNAVVKSNNNGIVTTSGKLTIDTAFTHKIDTIIGTAKLPQEIKAAIREKFIRSFNAIIDSSDKNNIKIQFEIKSKVTTEGIQDFHHSEGDLSKPFTLVKYNAKVGDKYEFTDKDGNKFVREVTQRSTTDDFPVGFWLIKVIVVEETLEEGPFKDLFGKITYYTNHKFGLVAVEYEKDGKKYRIGVWPPNL